MKVRITCPHCGFTTWVEGGRIPAKARYAACPRCRERFPLRPEGPPGPSSAGREDEPEAFPAEGEAKEEPLSPDSTSPEPHRGPSPWEDRDRIGLWPGIHRSFVSVLFSPAVFFRNLHCRNGLKEPFAVGLLFGSLGAMVSLFWDFVLAVWGLGGGINALASRFNVSLLFPLLLVLSPLMVGAALFVMSGVLHAFLWMARGSKHGFEGTFRVVAYGQMTQIFGAVPFLGGLIGGLWYMVVLVIGLREIHETTYGRVILAFLLITAAALAVLLAALIPVMMSLFR
ncbi:MAG: YIP1 family protein [Deltaproteobacteria bacterium]|nr:YIP1 family protein [Deltaproteobacteria bacterium]